MNMETTLATVLVVGGTCYVAAIFYNWVNAFETYDKREAAHYACVLAALFDGKIRFNAAINRRARSRW